jgi:hypothetical protein
MNEGNFKLEESGWYEVKNSQPNDFINENLQSEEYGIYYSVGFVGDADTFLWQTKTPPIVGEKYWGWLEEAKSGKSTKFKWDKKNAPANTPDGKPSTQTKQQNSNSNSITLGLVWKILIGIQGVPTNDEEFAKFYETVNAHVSELLSMSEKLNREE